MFVANEMFSWQLNFNQPIPTTIYMYLFLTRGWICFSVTVTSASDQLSVVEVMEVSVIVVITAAQHRQCVRDSQLSKKYRSH